MINQKTQSVSITAPAFICLQEQENVKTSSMEENKAILLSNFSSLFLKKLPGKLFETHNPRCQQVCVDYVVHGGQSFWMDQTF
jgi:hypothetical protein